MRLYTVETRNFEFYVFCENGWEFENLFEQAWRKHCESCQIPFEKGFYDILVQDYGEGYVEIADGLVYRDRQLFMAGNDSIMLEEYRGHDYGED